MVTRIFPGQLKAATDPQLKAYTLIEEVHGPLKFDMFPLYLGYWRAVTIRNPTRNTLSYRTDPYQVADSIPIESERDVAGWGSYLEIVGTGTAINAVLVFSMVNQGDAYLE